MNLQVISEGNAPLNRIVVLGKIIRIETCLDNAKNLAERNNFKLAKRCYVRAVELYQELSESVVQCKSDAWFQRVYGKYEPRFMRKKSEVYPEISVFYRVINNLSRLNQSRKAAA